MPEILRICHEINFHFDLSKSAYASLSSIGVPQYASFLRLAYTDLYCVKIKSYFMAAPYLGLPIMTMLLFPCMGRYTTPRRLFAASTTMPSPA